MFWLRNVYKTHDCLQALSKYSSRDDSPFLLQHDLKLLDASWLYLTTWNAYLQFIPHVLNPIHVKGTSWAVKMHNAKSCNARAVWRRALSSIKMK